MFNIRLVIALFVAAAFLPGSLWRNSIPMTLDST